MRSGTTNSMSALALKSSTENRGRSRRKPCSFTDNFRRNRTRNSVPIRQQDSVNRFVLRLLRFSQSGSQIAFLPIETYRNPERNRDHSAAGLAINPASTAQVIRLHHRG